MKLNLFNGNDSSDDLVRARRCFRWTFALTLLLKLWLAAYFPITGDEAFFYQWGAYPDWGYYDHPPMVGWLLYLLNHISSHPLSLRIVTVFLWSVVSLGLVDLMRRLLPAQPATAYWLGSLFLALPFAWTLNVVTTDTPLILFMFVSGYCFIRATLSDKKTWFAASGVFLGLALLSKYFAGLLAIAYLVYLVRTRKGWLNLLLLALCALPFAAINIAYNATHCWNNVMFNLLNRHEDAHWSFGTVALYLVMMVYLVTPWVALKLLRTRHALGQRGALTVLFLVPFALFLLLSTKKTIGLHWVLGFMPFVFLFIGTVSSTDELQKYFRWTAWLGIPHFLALAVIILLPLSAWKNTHAYDDIVFHKQTGNIVTALRNDLPKNSLVMARAYTPASLLSYYAGEYWAVFGEGKHHARQDDIIVDFRRYAGRPIRIFDRKPIEPDELAPYFESVSTGSFEVSGVQYWYADGKNFNYTTYREHVLKKIAAHYYRIPAFLPVYGCQFLQRYDLEGCCKQ
ncbi:MAG: glycosyltransferase family 39 protein [Burkholderiaceae bacterium]|nr:MAG: glycosyltransferase family 39 protein [Burkholderiaceae bacterium]